jgi:OPA family glycerol-3-phosphate transporter-like MFS transporter
MPASNLAPAEPRPRELLRWQLLTAALLFAGYAAYYFCRSDLSVAMPLIIEELRRKGMSASEAMVGTGIISSYGVGVYAAGKFLLTGLADLWGGKRNFLFGLAGAVLFTLLFAASGSLPFFTLTWVGNRISQSGGWAGLIKVCSKWFGYSSYGTVVGILSLSYLIGDAIARQSMGFLIQRGFGWRSLFVYAAIVGAITLVCNLFLLRDSRTDAGFSEPEVNPLNLFAKSDEEPTTLVGLFRTLLSSRGFITVCLLSFGCTVVRETFGIWTPTYLHDAFHFSVASAAVASALFPAFGAVSVVLSGWLSDRIGALGRSTITFTGLGATTVALLCLTFVPTGMKSVTPLILICTVAFCLLGPYSYLAGAFALDFGGARASAASSGIIDGIGYLGGVLAGYSIARVAVAYGWRGVFVALGLVSAFSTLAAAYLFLQQRRAEQGNQGLG